MFFCFLGFFVGGYIRQYILLKKAANPPLRLMIFFVGICYEKMEKNQLMSRATKNLKLKNT